MIGEKDNIDDKPKSKEKQMTEAGDVLNVDCTEEIDEFTSFLNEFEDELKEKPKKDKLSVAPTTKSKVIDVIRLFCLEFKTLELIYKIIKITM